VRLGHRDTVQVVMRMDGVLIRMDLAFERMDHSTAA
jgi:hypothetical protein